MRLAVPIALLALTLLAPGDADAHSRSVSYSSWEIDGGEARVTLRLALLELTRLRPDPLRGPLLDPALATYLTERLQLRAGDHACPVSAAPRALAAPVGRVGFEWRVDCGDATPTEIRSLLFLDVAPSHLHFARLRGAGATKLEHILSSAESSWRLDGEREAASSEPQGSSLTAYLALGVEHIATGYDHLVFLLALLLLATRLGEVATIVTGFTIAHSITLALAVLGRLRPEAQSVEALIGLSIALVAAENAWLLSNRARIVPVAVAVALAGMAGLGLANIGALSAATSGGLCVFAVCYFAILSRTAHPVRLRFAIAFVFGLVHGFGFAGVLEEISLSRERLAQALLGFNLGVEAGQILVVALLWPLLRWLASWRGGRAYRRLLEVGTGAICATGVFWLASRAYF